MRPTSAYLNDLAFFKMEDWNTTLLALGEEYQQATHAANEVFFVQIGAMDGKSFDPIFPHEKRQRWSGLVVEPLPDYFATLQENYSDVPDLKFERAAIADHDGTLTMRRVKAEAIEKGTVPDWVGGVSSSQPDRGVLGGKALTDFEYQRFIVPNMEDVTVPSMTWNSLLAKHGIGTFAVLIVDVEGAEWSVIQQIDLVACQPRLALIEYAHMPDAEFNACFEKFRAAGYRAFREVGIGENMLFVR